MEPVILLEGVDKEFRLRGRQQRGESKKALNRVDLTIHHGERVGIIGRNGSGKTTLLNLIAGSTAATRGSVRIRGTLQTLMAFGLGFHEELTGEQNVNHSLLLNRLSPEQQQAALADIVDFAELDRFFLYPFKTYSLGMKARLEFATATAIRPEILLIDEVLGAGDGYFSGKCADRMNALITDTTLLLVSHSMKQILSFCDRVLWLDDGAIRMDGCTAEVVKAYETFMVEQEATINSRIQYDQRNQPVGEGMLPDGSKAEAASRALLVPESASNLPSIRDASWTNEDRHFLLLETGEGWEARVDIHSPMPVSTEVQVRLLAFSDNGRLIWDAESDPYTLAQAGPARLAVGTGAFAGGVGNHILSIGLYADGRLVDARHASLIIKARETNFSDPPYLHCPGHWIYGDDPTRIPSRINAWV